MTIRFVRIAGEADRIYVRRSDGSETSWTFPSFGIEVPHDLVHLVVESKFGLRQGFWGRVDAGVDPVKVNQQANRNGGKDKYAGFGEDLTELYLAEALAGLSWQMRELPSADRYAMFRDNCEKSGLTPPDAVNETTLNEVQVRLNELRAQWRTLVPKGTIELTFG
jgi:hypothetical protein